MTTKMDRGGVHADLIRAELEKVLKSAMFARSERLRDFLELIVGNELRRGPPLKETVIGVQVYGRSAGYDPKVDPIVRTEARRLRSKLEQYYAGPGSQNTVSIQVPAGGYSPCFEMNLVPQSAAQVPPPQENRPASKRNRGWQIVLALTALLAVFSLGVLIWVAGRAGRTPPVEMPVTRLSGNEFQPSLSPDGSRVAFVWDGSAAQYDIYIKDISSGQMQRITNSRGESLFPSWAPDGRHLSFLRLFPGGEKQVLEADIPKAGQPIDRARERVLCDLQAAQPTWVQDASLIDLSPGPVWSPDGKNLAITDRENAHDPDAIYLLSIATGKKRRVTQPNPGSAGDFFPAFSPDGRELAFVRVTNQRRTSDIYVRTLSTGRERRVTTDGREIMGLTWATRTKLLFSSVRGPDARLWMVPSDGGTVEPIANVGAGASFPSAGANGAAVVYSERFRNSDVWRIPIGNGNVRKPAERVIESLTQNNSAQYSPDARKIVFVTDRSGVLEIWTSAADGSAASRLVSGAGSPIGSPRWSPDGTQIVYDVVRRGRSIVELVSAAGGGPRVLAAGTTDAMMPSWSHDGRYVYYVSAVHPQRVEIWKQPLSGGPAWQLTHQGGGEAFESPDGRTVYFLKARQGVWQVASEGGNESPVPGLENVFTSRYFFVANSGLYFLGGEEPPWKIEHRRFGTGAISEVLTLDHAPEFGTPSLAVSPDELNILYAQLDQSGEDLMILRNAKF